MNAYKTGMIYSWSAYFYLWDGTKFLPKAPPAYQEPGPLPIGRHFAGTVQSLFRYMSKVRRCQAARGILRVLKHENILATGYTDGLADVKKLAGDVLAEAPARKKRRADAKELGLFSHHDLHRAIKARYGDDPGSTILSFALNFMEKVTVDGEIFYRGDLEKLETKPEFWNWLKDFRPETFAMMQRVANSPSIQALLLSEQF